MSGRVTPYEETKILSGVPPMPEGETLILPGSVPAAPPEVIAAPAKPRRWPAALAAAAVLLLAGFSWWAFGPLPGSEARPVTVRRAALPPYLQTYREAAAHGDAKAMRMLGASYTYGLGVHADRAEGLAWYRKAADAGDKAAAQELKAVSPH